MVVDRQKRIQFTLELLEVQRDADLILLRRTDHDGDFVVVSVQFAAVAVVAAQLVRRRKRSVDFNFKHDFIPFCLLI